MAPRPNTHAGWLSFVTGVKIDQLRDYLHVLHAQLDAAAEADAQLLNEDYNSMPDEDDRLDYEQFLYEQYADRLLDFPRILLNSFHLAVYALLESELLSVARRVEYTQKQNSHPEDLTSRGALIVAARRICELTGIRPQGFGSWPALTEARRLRNLIVHSNGLLLKSSDIDLAKRHGFLRESEYHIPSGVRMQQLSLSYDYCNSFLDSMRDFFDDLHVAAERHV